VLPAVGQLRLVEHAASLLKGTECELESVARARFQDPVVPGDALELSLDLSAPARIDWTFRRGRSAASPAAEGPCGAAGSARRRRQRLEPGQRDFADHA
jgi:hypothetical protein